jgi:pimeloyl-ACP methyl ester carboxylesterase
MYLRSIIDLPAGQLFFRHSKMNDRRPTILFIHGLGDSGRSFLEAFQEPCLRGFNIVVPDLFGYGKSISTGNDASEYVFEKQIGHLYRVLDDLNVEKFLLVGHSMGGDIGTLMCAADREKRIGAFANIEGDLTQGDRFMTNRILAAEETGAFECWLRHCFTKEIVPSLLKNRAVARRRYQASLRLCRAEAFLQNAKEIYALNANLDFQQHAIIASIFHSLATRKRYFSGARSLSQESRQYLQDKDYFYPPFEESFHWVMLDRRTQFYAALSRFLQGEE